MTNAFRSAVEAHDPDAFPALLAPEVVFPYDLKALAAEMVGHFWPIPHAQLYRDAPSWPNAASSPSRRAAAASST
ncbi:hypothetical protein AB0L40_07150 [Patulibacter sp. NPDC049589]|uniref:hypothetical protein n=1 Tax=Patulibacter sp. NPDC049589 TaxID=3154731 RepID=UPI0034172AD2